MATPIDNTISVIGVKPNISYFHNTMRIVVLCLLIIILFMIFYSDTRSKKEKVSVEAINDMIRPGTKLYEVIMDMDPKSRKLFVASLEKALDMHNEPSKLRFVMKTVLSALFISFVAEYIIHGNVVKVLGVTGRTGLSAILTALT